MKKLIELRVNYNYAHLLFKADEGVNIGTSVRLVELEKNDKSYNQIPIISKSVKEKFNSFFFSSWDIKRYYTKRELNSAKLFHMKIKSVFEPAGEECGTLYDESVACKVCGANRIQISPLLLKKSSIPKKDIAKTIGGEVIGSERLKSCFEQRNLKGIEFKPILFKRGEASYYQLLPDVSLNLSKNTLAGVNPWDFSEEREKGIHMISGYEVKFDKEVYKCPKGHTLGLRLLSEPYIIDTQKINEFDFFSSVQKIGVKRGLLNPEPIYLCSASFRNMVMENKLSGFGFEIARVE